ncbi:MAG: DUF4149 domain-containing protein [Gemmatimonadota bacterium]|nr:DUF4149 domain-containing protein [Gemmatimonadota bacterium]
MSPAPKRAVASVALASLWMGAAVFLSAVLAPNAFRVLPTRTLAGAIVGATLPAVLVAGIVVGAALIALALPAYTSSRRGQLGGAATLVVACATAQFVIGAKIERVRSAITGPIDLMPATDPLRAQFGQLHALSVLALGVAILAAIAAGAFAVRSLRDAAVRIPDPR